MPTKYKAKERMFVQHQFFATWTEAAGKAEQSWLGLFSLSVNSSTAAGDSRRGSICIHIEVLSRFPKENKIIYICEICTL